MRVVFLLALLAGGLFYAWYAFAELSFLSRTGRLGPGFFPRIIGVSLVALCLLSLVRDLRGFRWDDARTDYWPTIGAIAVLSAAMIWLFTLVGGPLAMGLFLFATLSFLNRGHLVQNAAIAVLLPTGIYFLFDVWLNASMPDGRFDLPI
jgi:hypothetical protein